MAVSIRPIFFAIDLPFLYLHFLQSHPLKSYFQSKEENLQVHCPDGSDHQTNISKYFQIFFLNDIFWPRKRICRCIALMAVSIRPISRCLLHGSLPEPAAACATKQNPKNIDFGPTCASHQWNLSKPRLLS